MSISLCMIVKDEERCIIRSLNSVVNVVDEMVIVDTGSSDNTLNLLQQFKKEHSSMKIKIVSYAWNDDFSMARNCSLYHATSKYLFHLDADEWLSPDSINELMTLKNRLVSEEELYLVRLSISNTVLGNVFETDRNVRIFPKNSKLRYTRKVHETLGDCLVRYFKDIKTIDSSICIYHDGYDPFAVNQKQKRLRNVKLLNEMIQQDPNDATSIYYFARDLRDINPVESLNVFERLNSLITKEHPLKQKCEHFIKELETKQP